MPKLFPGINHFIPLPQAQAMTARYRANKSNILSPAFIGTNTLLDCETFNREEFDWVLAQKDCVGLRIYFGMEENLQVRLLVTGVNINGDDIISEAGANLTEPPPSGVIELGRPCPTYCPTTPL